MNNNGRKLVGAVILVGLIAYGWAQTIPTAGGGKIVSDPLDIIFFQGFVWESWKSDSWYNVMKGAANEIADAGITDVWFPPSCQSAADGPQGYLPEKLYDLESNYGTSEQLRQTIQAFHQNGVRCVCDAVINHRWGSKQDDKGDRCIFEGGTDDGRLDWGAWAVPMKDQPYSCGSGKAEDPEADFKGAPDIDHTNPRVQSELSEWMKWLMSDIGFDGWRFDFAKGYAVSSVALYVQNTAPAFAVGEIWETLNFGNGGENAHRQRLVDWVHSTGDRSAAFDFTTKGILQVAVQNNELWRLKDSDGKPSGMIGVLPEKAVTFVDNHDTGATQQNISAFPPDKLMQGYAYILTHPGVPTIFYEHFEDTNLKDSIKKLIEVRKRNKIKANSACTIITAEDDLYMATIEERVIMKIGARFAVGNLEPSKEFFQLAISGKDYAVWERKP